MHVGQIITADCANGPGIRLSVFVSGCTNRCKGCFQPQTWAFDFGREYTEAMRDSIIDELKKPFYQGITILGGEPFEFENQPEVAKLIEKIRAEVPDRDIWLYTGFTYDEDLAVGGKRYGEYTERILSNADVVVDGKFVEELKDIRLEFRGSSNQRIIDLKKSRGCGKVILWKS